MSNYRRPFFIQLPSLSRVKRSRGSANWTELNYSNLGQLRRTDKRGLEDIARYTKNLDDKGSSYIHPSILEGHNLSSYAIFSSSSAYSVKGDGSNVLCVVSSSSVIDIQFLCCLLATHKGELQLVASFVSGVGDTVLGLI